MKFIFILLSSLLLGCLLVMSVQRNSLVSGQEWNKNNLEVTEITAISAQKKHFGSNGAYHMRKLFGTTIHHEETNVDSKNGKGEISSKISGDENNINLKKSFRRLLQAQKNDVQHVVKMKKAYLKVNKFAIPRKSLTTNTNTNTKCSQDCDVVPIKGSSDKSSRHEHQISKEAQDIDAEKEIESLMYKDYNNKGKPSHRPPINNHVPNNP
ncbi:unnamed protein product [Trifolium pratense]|uniref:Uncharacterized protein n=1 Tax=Trifolium pratense TaxID=57577 RepID=A0ACB0LL75_TRIPR|nr:unnamed protein product [Trifolium pratense]